jgi:hypothetical protein
VVARLTCFPVAVESDAALLEVLAALDEALRPTRD